MSGGQGPTQIRKLLHEYGVQPSKTLGQHFLADPNIVAKIVRIARVGPGDNVLEVGPGTGSLTTALVASGARVVAVEFDRGLARIVDDLLGPSIELHVADIMKLDLDDLLGSQTWTVVANLPYNVGTPFVLDVLRNRPNVCRFVVMVQREVGERMCAQPGSRLYGLPTLIVNLHATSRIAFKVPPQVFLPSPDVQSVVVEIDRITPAEPGAERAIRLAEVAFGQRRKMVRRSLASVFEEPAEMLLAAGIEPTARAEELSAADYLALAALA